MSRMLPIVFIGGVLFGFGLAFSTMVQPEVVLSFLQLNDLGLMLVMAAALAVALPVYQVAPRLLSRPIYGQVFSRAGRTIRPSTIVGAMIFGLGWGLSGVCPGAGVASVGIGNWPILFALAGMLAGAYVQGLIASSTPRDQGTTATSASVS